MDDDRGDGAGSAYVFERDEAGVWVEVAKLLASDGAPIDGFGRSVSLSGDRALVSAPARGRRTGSAYVFERDETGVWVEAAKLLATDGAPDDAFGRYYVSLSGDRALVGAHRHDYQGSDSGSAYMFDRDDSGAWTQVAELYLYRLLA